MAKGPVIAHATSDSGGRDHLIRLGRDNRVYCSCKAWKWSRGPVKDCKHLKRFRSVVAEEAAASQAA